MHEITAGNIYVDIKQRKILHNSSITPNVPLHKL